MNSPRRSFNQRRQQGAVLFVALVFLILITLLALTATGTSILQEKMTGGMRNRQLGLMGAESGLRGGEAFLLNLNFIGGNQLTQCPPDGAPTSTCAYVPQVDDTTARAGLDPAVQSFRTARSWVAPPGGAPTYPHTLTGQTGDLETASLHAEPVLVVEALGSDSAAGGGDGGWQQTNAIDAEKSGVGSPILYRITSRSQGGSGAVLRVAESVYSAMNLGAAGANPDAAP
ncbi:PilX N-terminal domain-containing pilus assembly protein [Dokdonella sp.]|uniref:pilus assembly PilX family protein n=1 Tax=Dokdonella sp. TaxID=2291710 RepID=UPI00378300C5